ncbi:MAG: LPS export ABC transporter periplasmic protein LptC [Bacteroidota bacterium]|nr:LPS export ABC transporter periplasmic protein LptC [Bacteroidota bacterium]
MTVRSFLALAVLLLLTGTGCEMHESGVSVQTLRDDEAPVSESWSSDIVISEDGLRRLVMQADYMARYETPDSTYMVLTGVDEEADRVRVVIFNPEGDTSAVVTSLRILYHEVARRFVARGDVDVKAGSDRWLESEHLAWSEITSRVTTPGFATIRTPTETLSGYGLDADENLTEFTLTRVTGTVLIEDE